MPANGPDDVQPPLLFERVPEQGACPANGPLVVCPWAAGLRLPDDLWLSVLPIHDANAWIDGPAPIAWGGQDPARVYFGVFALDSLRSRHRLFQALLARGVRGIVNLPSVGFFDGASGEHLRALGYAVEKELAFLHDAAQAGLRVGAFTDRPAALTDGERRAFDFVLTGNPEEGMSRLPGPALTA